MLSQENGGRIVGPKKTSTEVISGVRIWSYGVMLVLKAVASNLKLS